MSIDSSWRSREAGKAPVNGLVKPIVLGQTDRRNIGGEDGMPVRALVVLELVSQQTTAASADLHLTNRILPRETINRPSVRARVAFELIRWPLRRAATCSEIDCDILLSAGPQELMAAAAVTFGITRPVDTQWSVRALVAL